jgi:hypothetical protein
MSEMTFFKEQPVRRQEEAGFSSRAFLLLL